ncbi:hypothetical protein [Yersinia phage vB_YenM_P8]|nr:hypothetical protein MN01_00249 [Escherichia phage MN01]WMU95646.1 hypothetical protein [Escherichia phage pEC-M719-6WT.2]
MEIGKKYEFNPHRIKSFIDISSSNASMVDIIQENGGWFEVKSISSADGYDYVTEIICANGAIYNDDGMGDDYFELSEEEFYCFREYSNYAKTPSGAVSINCVVDANNVDQIIELLQKAFK